MKLRKLFARLGLAAVLLAILNLQLSTAFAQGTAFTYQGRLDIAGSPANGTNDLTFTLYDAVAAGATVGTSNTVNDLVITNGLFTVTLDFGAGAFNGAARWLQIAARPGVSTGAYTNLAPRQPITPAPYAVFAGGAAAAGVTGTLPAGALAGAYSGSVNLSNVANSFAGNGGGLTSLNASNLTTGTVADTRLSANVALLNRSPQNFTGSNTFGGNMGIGTTTPNFPLSFPNSGGEKISLYGQDTNSIHGIGIGGLRMEFYVPTTGHSFDFGVGNSMNFSPKMRISGNGNVGIGIASPVAQLDVRGPSTLVGGIALGDYNITNSRYIGIIGPGQPANISAGSGFSGVEFGGPAGNTNSGLLAFHTHNFGGGSSEKMRITKAGNVGIGTTNPYNQLDVGAGMVIGNSTVVNNQHDAFNRGTKVSFGYNIPQPGFPDEFNGMRSTVIGPLGCGNAGIVNFFTWQCGVSSSREVMRINGFGNVGIGTASPAYRLHVQDSGAQTGRIQVGGTAADGSPKIISFGDGDFVTIGENNADDRMELTAGTFAFLSRYAGAGPALEILSGVLNGVADTNAVTLEMAGNKKLGIWDDLVVSGEVTCTAINLTSDRNAKEHFKPVSGREVLDKVARLPITEWQYKGQDKQPSDGTRHIGPMAQDFHAAFGTGRDDKHITSMDADGVALAAIQGLNEIVLEKNEELSRLKKENQSLAERLAAIERALGLRGESKP